MTTVVSHPRRLLRYWRERGIVWTLLFLVRAVLWRLRDRVESVMRRIEMRRFIVGDNTVSGSSHSIEENRSVWNASDWSQVDQEWTDDAGRYRTVEPETWMRQVIDELMEVHIPQGGVVLEVGPGAGRWTEPLLERSSRLHLADVSEVCLNLCQDRFGGGGKLECHQVRDSGGLDAIADRSVDAIWSYDVFVHINPTDVDWYLGEFGRILKPEARAVIHHAGEYTSTQDAQAGWRASMDAGFFAHLVGKHGMEVMTQNTTLPHKPGDVITVFRMPAT